METENEGGGVENESEGWGSGDGWWESRETGSVTKMKEKKNRRPVSVPASPLTSGIKRRAT